MVQPAKVLELQGKAIATRAGRFLHERLLSEAFEFFDERGPLQIEELRRAAFIATGPLERSLDELPLDMRDEDVQVETAFGQGDSRGKRRLRLLNFHGKIGDVNLGPSGV